MSVFSRVSLLKNYDWPLLGAMLALIAVGFAAVYSVDLSRGETLQYFSNQLVAVIIGMVIFFIAANLHISIYQFYAKWFYLAALGLLVAVLFLGTQVRGTTGWFRLGSFSFQPAEAAKAALILFLGWLVSRYGRRFDTSRFFLVSGVIAGLLAGLIFLQPDLGSAAVIFSIWFGILFFAGVKKRYLVSLILLLVVGFVAGWLFFFEAYQRDRLITFFDPGHDPLEAGYNITQSIIAVGAGQIFGRGLGSGSQSQLHFLPEAQTDFIFSVIAEELGLVGTLTILILFFLIFWRLTRIVQKTRSEFGAYTVLGIILFFLTQLILNVGGAIGLLPITGVTLPLVSYGGSSLIICCFLLGVAESIARFETDGLVA